VSFRLTERNTFSSFTIHCSSDVARRAVMGSVCRYSLYLKSSACIRSYIMPGRTAPPTPAYYWSSASPLPKFHI